MSEVKRMSGKMFLLPAAKGTCPECATAHGPEQPHNCQSLYYQMKFQMENDRSPTWADAMAHCTQDIKNFWIAELNAKGVDV